MVVVEYSVNEIGKYRLLPVVTIKDLKGAVGLGKALLAGGLPLVEVALRTDIAFEAIKLLTREYSDLLIGAGTVLSIQQVQNAVIAGARFIVTPGFNPRVVDYCTEKMIPIIPGISSPTLVEMALERNINVVKFFPAEVLGGIGFLRAISEPYPSVKFIPTGGINQANLKSYLSCSCVYACGGSWLVQNSLITTSKFAEITKLVRDALSIVGST